MAIIKWNGPQFSVRPVKQLDNGDWLVRALEAGPRWTVGTMLQIKAADIVSLKDEDTPNPAARAAELEAAMLAERETLPSVAELLAKRTSYEDQGSGYDPGATGHELAGRKTKPA